jgi:hypothetical protein
MAWPGATPIVCLESPANELSTATPRVPDTEISTAPSPAAAPQPNLRKCLGCPLLEARSRPPPMPRTLGLGKRCRCSGALLALTARSLRCDDSVRNRSDFCRALGARQMRLLTRFDLLPTRSSKRAHGDEYRHE